MSIIIGLCYCVFYGVLAPGPAALLQSVSARAPVFSATAVARLAVYWLFLLMHAGKQASRSTDAGCVLSSTAGRKQFARHEWAQKAAYLLGCSLEELSSSIFKHQPKGGLQKSTSFRQGPDESGSGDGSGRRASTPWGPSLNRKKLCSSFKPCWLKTGVWIKIIQ